MRDKNTHWDWPYNYDMSKYSFLQGYNRNNLKLALNIRQHILRLKVFEEMVNIVKII